MTANLPFLTGADLTLYFPIKYIIPIRRVIIHKLYHNYKGKASKYILMKNIFLFFFDRNGIYCKNYNYISVCHIDTYSFLSVVEHMVIFCPEIGLTKLKLRPNLKEFRVIKALLFKLVL